MKRVNENDMNVNYTKQSSMSNIRWMLVGYDLIVYALVAVILLVLYGGMNMLSTTGILQQVCLSVLCILQHVLLEKYMCRYGDMVEYNVISDCCLPILLPL